MGLYLLQPYVDHQLAGRDHHGEDSFGGKLNQEATLEFDADINFDDKMICSED